MDMLPLNALVAVNTSVVSDVPETLTLIELSFSTPSNTFAVIKVYIVNDEIKADSTVAPNEKYTDNGERMSYGSWR